MFNKTHFNSNSYKFKLKHLFKLKLNKAWLYSVCQVGFYYNIYVFYTYLRCTFSADIEMKNH